jgi:hypothetical protein
VALCGSPCSSWLVGCAGRKEILCRPMDVSSVSLKMVARAFTRVNLLQTSYEESWLIRTGSELPPIFRYNPPSERQSRCRISVSSLPSSTSATDSLGSPPLDHGLPSDASLAIGHAHRAGVWSSSPPPARSHTLIQRWNFWWGDHGTEQMKQKGIITYSTLHCRLSSSALTPCSHCQQPCAAFRRRHVCEQLPT